MTQEDFDLHADLEMLGIPGDVVLHYRKYICFIYDSIAKRPHLVYCKLARELLQKPEISLKESRNINYVNPGMDTFLYKCDQLKMEDYQSLPEGYAMGHLIGRAHVRWSKRIYDIMNTFSVVAIEHGSLIRGYWLTLEEYVQGLLLNYNYNVRTFAGTAG